MNNGQEKSCNQRVLERTENCPLCIASATAHFMHAPDRFHWRRDEYELLRCSQCSCVWLANPPAPNEMGLHYSEDYHKAIMAAGEGSAITRWRTQREQIFKRKQGGNILDVGCSSGGFLGTMRSDSWKLFGIEMEASTAERARTATGAEVFVGDVVDAPFAGGSFDVVTCFDVLEHVYQPRKFLTKILEWLKPGGILYVGIPNIASWEARSLGTYWYGLELPRHLFHFSPQSLKYLMTSVGFQEISLLTPGTTYVERSASYLFSAALQKFGVSPTPMAISRPPRLPKRLIRKALRLSLIAPFGRLASVAGVGASMEAIFAKPV
jgi:2-polyprenyl-3-methyl-5-hydroxy-6-metoxy-1,4-benzoquinol methylase